MKKLLAVGLTLIMALSLGFTSLAAPNGFVISPSSSASPKLVSYSNSDPDCVATLVLTSYSDRAQLDDETRTRLETAYNQIVESSDLTKLNDDLKKRAEEKNVSGKDLSVSDLFDLSYYDCAEHDEHGYFTVTIEPEILKNFFGLMCYVDGKWVLIEDAEVISNGTQLKFKFDEAAPFAIVMDTSDYQTSKDTPNTGSARFPYGYLAVVAASLLGFTAVIIALKKQKA